MTLPEPWARRRTLFRLGSPLSTGAMLKGVTWSDVRRSVDLKGDARALDEKSLAKARSLAGLKGYVTNLPATVMPAADVIGSYHDLWHVEQSFRMSKTDL